MKKFLAIALAIVFSLTAAQAAGAQTLYENKSISQISQGLNYEYSKRVTTNGLLDVHVLTVDVRQEHLEVKPLASKTEHGLKETLTALIDANGAVAGVNGDFFGLSGTYSAPFGLEIIDGNVTNTSRAFNSGEDRSATLFISENNTPFMEYVKTDVIFVNNGVENLELYAYNRVTDGILPVYIDRNAYETTAELDARFQRLYKIVVENGVITYISSGGETVEVPENGFVVVISENTANYHLNKYAVGQSAQVTISSGIDLGKVKAAISGAGKILSAGYYTEEDYYIEGRHPRTVIGLDSERSKLILMVVDGRGQSVGASHRELADILIEYGAYNAMHLDGGGSSTMAVRTDGQSVVKNTPSDGGQRRIINGLGVFNNSTPSSPTALAIDSDSFAFKDIPIKVSAYGLDEYLNRIELEDIVIDPGDGGRYEDGYFYPARTGDIVLKAAYGELVGEKTIKVQELAQINTTAQTLALRLEEEYTFSLTGKSEEGRVADIDRRGVSVEIVPEYLAAYTEGKLVGLSQGAGYVKLSAGGVVRYVALAVGTRDVPLDIPWSVSYQAYPNTNPGSAGAGFIEYQMTQSSSTQAAYAVFNEAVLIQGKPIGLRLAVDGDNSNNWLRGRIIDANGEEYAIDFARYVDWTETKIVEAKIPSDAAFPIRLERIYIAALENTTDERRRISFRDLTAVYAIEADTGALPASAVYRDKKMAELSQGAQQDYTDITLLGSLIGAERDIQNKYITEFNRGADYGLFMGQPVPAPIGMPTYRWIGTYDSYTLGHAKVINLVAVNGNMYSSNLAQWQRIKGDLGNAGNNVLVIIDKNPLVTLPRGERELLHELLAGTGKNIVVVSAEGTQTTAVTTDGIRYINLGSLVKADGSLNEGFKNLRVRFFENDMQYNLR